jgi:glycosyltransferase involved in cell wall biosynthesis
MVGQEGKPDFIEAQDYLGIAYYLTQFKHLGYEFAAGIPIVVTLHSPAFVYLEYNRVSTYRFPDFWTCEMEKQAIKAADVLISPTRFLVDEIQRFMDISDKNVHIVPNPYAPPAAAHPIGHTGNAPPPSAHLKVQRNKIVYYGKLSPQKGSFELLAYFKDLWDNGFQHPLHIVGGTDIVYHPEMQTMGQLVNKRYGSYITKGLLQLHGKIRPQQIGEYLQDAHVILVPSIVDNLPYVVMEAMSLGKIVLASVQGGQREMITDGATGFLFDHTDPPSFARQLTRVLALTEEEVQRIGQNASRAIDGSYSFASIFHQKIKILQDFSATTAGQGPEHHSHHYFPFLQQEYNKPLTPAHAANDLLSVVIPYYNMGEYIEECLRSVIDSTYKDIEVIIINDGSTDLASIQKLDSIAASQQSPNAQPGQDSTVRSGQSAMTPSGQDPMARSRLIRIIHQKNQGLALTRNIGAAIARGSWLAFLDADDMVAPTYYAKAITALKHSSNAYFAGAWVQYFGNIRQLWPTFIPQPPYALVHNPVNSSGLVYKKEAFLAAGLNDKALDFGLEDYESVVSLLHQGFNGIVLPEPLFHYRVRSGSMFRKLSIEKLLYANKYITEKHGDYYAKFAPQIINLLNANGPGYLFDNPTIEVSVTSKMAGKGVWLRKAESLVKRNERLKKIALTIKKLKR